MVGEITEGKPTAIDGGNEITLDVRADELFRLYPDGGKKLDSGA